MMDHRGLRAVQTLAAVLFLAAFGRGAQAQLTFHDHEPGALQPGENVLMDSNSGFNVFGHTNQTNTPVTFTSDEDIFAPAQGQARVEAVDGAYTTLCFELASGFGFKEIEFNVNAEGRTDGSITLEVFGVGSDLPFQTTTFLNAQGENWFSFEAGPATTMTKVCITSTIPITDTRQWRVGGVGPLGNVPEGSSMAMLGVGIIPVLGLVIKRRRTAAGK
jgi:hypothetical protein